MSKTSQKKQEISSQNLIAIIAVAAMAFISILVETSMNVTFPTLMKTMHVSLSTVQWVTTGYLLVVSLLMIISAFLKQRFTNRQLFITAGVLFILGASISSFAPVFPILLVGRLIQAGSAGISIPLMVNVVVESAPKSKLGLYLGMTSLIMMVAPASGPTFGGVMVAMASWRMIFWSTLPLVAIILIFGLFVIRKGQPNRAAKFDWRQFLLLAVALISIMMGFNSLSTQGWLSWQFIGGVLIGIFGLVGYSWTAKRSQNQLLRLEIFKNPVFTFSFFAYMILQFSNMGINFALPNYAQIVIGAGSLIGGMMLLPGSLLTAALQPWFGHLLDKYGAKLPILLGSSLFLVSAIGFTAFGKAMTVPMIIVMYIVYSVGRSMAYGNTLTNAFKEVSPEQQTDANAIFNTGQQFAGSLGTSVVAVLMSSVKGGDLSYRAATATGTQLAFGLILIFSMVLLGLYAIVFKYQKKFVEINS